MHPSPTDCPACDLLSGARPHRAATDPADVEAICTRLRPALDR